jgi:hypothetical protein|tara:strand:- start:783 stop:962 length:180 start_codon:yes stop_codon:yes gene_type:complete
MTTQITHNLKEMLRAYVQSGQLDEGDIQDIIDQCRSLLEEMDYTEFKTGEGRVPNDQVE